MDKLDKIYIDILNTISCIVDNQPIGNKLNNLGEILNISKEQSIDALMYYGLKDQIKNSSLYEEWELCHDKAVRRNIMYASERSAIVNFFNDNKISYMLMKGLVLQNYYPKSELRQMGDNDILFDPKHEDELISFMKNRGYEVTIGEGRHFDCKKDPIFNFEMHRSLFKAGMGKLKRFYEYYKDIEAKLVKSPNNPNEMLMSDEDLYIYLLCHKYEDYVNAGFGIRFFVDICFFLKEKDKHLDWDYITHEVEKLDITDFYNITNSICKKIIDGNNDFTSSEVELLNKCFDNGTYGKAENYVKHKIAFSLKNPKLVIQYIFPSFKRMQQRGIPYAKKRYLVPLYWLRINISTIKNINRLLIKNIAAIAKNKFRNQ